jgi:Golgi phosphoprotein 3
MASAGGLTRRRGGGGGASTSNAEDDNDGSRVSSPVPKNHDKAPETSYTGGENGHKIAFDPRDMQETEERNKQPKLTLMEEVLLLGLKDKQVRSSVKIHDASLTLSGY